MRIHSHQFSSVLACTLVVLFFALSFNAYACLMPMNGNAAGGMGCSASDEQQYCDSFRTLGMQSADKPTFDSDSQTICTDHTASLPLNNFISNNYLLSDHPLVGLPKDLLLEISVLRI
jgi:hypothetical protein